MGVLNGYRSGVEDYNVLYPILNISPVNGPSKFPQLDDLLLLVAGRRNP